MRIAYTMPAGRGATDVLLAGLAGRLAARGLRLAGLVQVNTDRPGGGPCDMDVRVLPDGPVLRISQNLGAGARGCRLDPDALETAVSAARTRLEAGADLLIVNKFGKQEAAGGGFRPAVADALEREVPVLVGLNALNREAFEAFTGGLAEELPGEAEALDAWVLEAVGGALRPAG